MNELKQQLHNKIVRMQKFALSQLEKSKSVSIGGRVAYNYVPIVDMVIAILGRRQETPLEISVTTSTKTCNVEWTEKGARAIITGITTVTDLLTGYSESWESVGMSAASGDKAVDIATTFMKRNALKLIFHTHGVDELEEYNEIEPQKTTKKIDNMKKGLNISLTEIQTVEDFRKALITAGVDKQIVVESLKKYNVEKLDDLPKFRWGAFLIDINSKLKGE